MSLRFRKVGSFSPAMVPHGSCRWGWTPATRKETMNDNDRSLITLNGEPIPGRIESSDGMWALRVVSRHIYWPDRKARSGRVLAYTLDELFDAYLAENVFGCE